jgi:Sec-independent protein translocase protein TatA
MFSIADMAVAGAVALLLFGPDQLPKVARRAGQLMRDVQNTSQSFIREMERAADAHDVPDVQPADPSPVGVLPAVPAYHETPEPASHELVAREAALDPHPPAGEAPRREAPSTPGQPAP